MNKKFVIKKRAGAWYIHQVRTEGNQQEWRYVNYHATFEAACAQTAHLVDMLGAVEKALLAVPVHIPRI
jgi:hypothetical protein